VSETAPAVPRLPSISSPNGRRSHRLQAQKSSPWALLTKKQAEEFQAERQRETEARRRAACEAAAQIQQQMALNASRREASRVESRALAEKMREDSLFVELSKADADRAQKSQTTSHVAVQQLTGLQQMEAAREAARLAELERGRREVAESLAAKQAYEEEQARKRDAERQMLSSEMQKAVVSKPPTLVDGLQRKREAARAEAEIEAAEHARDVARQQEKEQSRRAAYEASVKRAELSLQRNAQIEAEVAAKRGALAVPEGQHHLDVLGQSSPPPKAAAALAAAKRGAAPNFVELDAQRKAEAALEKQRARKEIDADVSAYSAALSEEDRRRREEAVRHREELAAMIALREAAAIRDSAEDPAALLLNAKTFRAAGIDPAL
jgi:DNA repair exonuclease SbcCD ATPase subunit